MGNGIQLASDVALVETLDESLSSLLEGSCNIILSSFWCMFETSESILVADHIRREIIYCSLCRQIAKEMHDYQQQHNTMLHNSLTI